VLIDDGIFWGVYIDGVKKRKPRGKCDHYKIIPFLARSLPAVSLIKVFASC